MRFFAQGSVYLAKIRRQIFIFLTFFPIIFLILISFVFYKIYHLHNLIKYTNFYEEDISVYLEQFHSQLFLAGFLCIILILFQIFLLMKFIKKIIPLDLEMKNDEADKEIMSKVEVRNFDEMK